MNALLSMAAFALAASISPGPVNVVALGAGARHGFVASMPHVSGATLGFVALLLLVGLGLHEVLATWPVLTEVIRWAGVAFIVYLAYQLATDEGQLSADANAVRPSFLSGAAMQWLNPKAWLASVAGMGAYAGGGEAALVLRFAAVYFAVCYLSIAAWALAGARLRVLLQRPERVRALNRALAALLVASAVYMIAG